MDSRRSGTWKATTATLLAVVMSVSTARADAQDPVFVFAAASTTDVLEGLADLYETKHQKRVRPVLAASSVLARQIAQGAPADLYLSAAPQWMDYLAAAGKIEPGSRIDLLGNTLVLIAPADTVWQARVKPGLALSGILGDKPLAIADPGHVPAGIYAKSALQALDIWPSLQGRMAFAPNVRAALALVHRGEAGAGVVYATDARVSYGIRVVGSFPEASHPPVVYPLAIVRGRDRPAVRSFYRFLQGPEAAAQFRALGFRVLVTAS